MQFKHTVIESLAGVMPPEAWSSQEIEARLAPLYTRLKLPQGRLELMTGIRERRFWPQGTLPSQASAFAARAVLEKSALSKGQIDWVMHCAVSRDRLEPATAAYVHGALQMPETCAFFDLSNACLGFLNGLASAAAMVESGQIRAALVCAGENGRPLVENTIRELNASSLNRNEIKAYFANLTIGAGAAAAIVCHDSLCAKPFARLLSAQVRTDTLSNRLCEGDTAGDALAMKTDSEALLHAGVALAKKTWEAFCAESHWTAETPARIICHQVGRRHQLRLFETLGLDLKKDFSTFEILGNVGSVSLPITLWRARECGAVSPGEKAALLGIGSGLSCMMAAIQF